jgi:hypothetical protein
LESGDRFGALETLCDDTAVVKSGSHATAHM